MYFPFLDVLLVECEACSHVGLEDLCDGVDVGRCPDVKTQVHPDHDDNYDDNDNDDDYDDGENEDELSVCLFVTKTAMMMMMLHIL